MDLFPEVGYKYKMSNIQAAIGCAQVERIQELIKRKREIFLSYFNLLKKVDGLKMNPIPDDPQTLPGYWMPTIVFDKGIKFDRYKILEVFKMKSHFCNDPSKPKWKATTLLLMK